jgi:FkbM family methyltransferase
MAFFSYAQNFEDVMLWRALKHIPGGFYVDIGAQDPVFDSVSKGFYAHGWRGIHVEPNRQYSELLRKDRPDEIIINAALSDEPGMIRFYEIPDTGMSTASGEIADGHRRDGWKIVETLVPTTTLDQVFDAIDYPEIHWLKIDVEGYERAVLEGWRTSPQRPWIVVVEAIEPLTRANAHATWEQLLLDKGYSCVYFDGVNRFYVSDAHKELKAHFAYGPCLWDEFQLPEISRPVQSLVRCQRDALHQVREEAKASIAKQSEATAQLETYVAEFNAALSGVRCVLDETRGELHQTRGELHQTRGELHQTRGELDQTRGQLDQTRGELDQTRGELDQTRGELGQAHLSLNHKENELSRVQRDRDEVLVELTEIRSHLEQSQSALAQTQESVRGAQNELDLLNKELRRSAEASSRQQARLLAELQAVTGSLWWRISVPFRKRPIAKANPTATHERGGDATRPPVAASVQELLSYYGEDFVRCAYVTLLGREPEPEGLRNYLDQLRRNTRREAIIAALATSDEGNRFGAKLPGLDAMVKRHHRRTVNGLGRFFRNALGFRFSPMRAETTVDDGRLSVEQLLSLQDEAFVRGAYTALLGRDPDREGFRHYVASIRGGESRLAVIAQIRQSVEGRQRQPNIGGLDRAIRRYNRLRMPLLGPFLRLAEAGSRRVSVRRKLAALETQLDLLALPAASLAVGVSTDQQKISAPPPPPPPPQDVAETKAAMQKSASIEIHRPHVATIPLTWRIEGTDDHSQDLRLLRREIARALVEIGHRTEEASSAAPADVTALVASFFPPAAVHASFTLLVGHDWGESGYPAASVEKINATLVGVACASRHALKVLVDHGVDVPLAAIGLGVDHWERIIAPQDYRAPGKRFRFLHVSSCGVDQGIDLLIESFGRVFDIDDDVSLIIRPSGVPPSDVLKRLEQLRSANPRFPNVVVIEADLDDAQLKALYEQCHVFVAPSRAQGFGLHLAFALVSGLPLIATAWGGHIDYCDEANSWLIDYKFARSRSANNLAISVWAEPIGTLLEEALWTAYRTMPAERSAKAQSGRKKLLKRFTWTEVAMRLADFANGIKAKGAKEA